jgi:hypothetical protein
MNATETSAVSPAAARTSARTSDSRLDAGAALGVDVRGAAGTGAQEAARSRSGTADVGFISVMAEVV